MKEYATIKIIDDQCKREKGLEMIKAYWTKEQHDKIVRNVDRVTVPADCCDLSIDPVNTGSAVCHKGDDVYRVHSMTLTVRPALGNWAPRFRCQPGVAWDDCRSCAEMMAKGKCVDARMREIVGAVLYPQWYGRTK